MKTLIYIIIGVVILGGGYMLLTNTTTPAGQEQATSTTGGVERMMADSAPVIPGASVVPSGDYTVIPTQSTFNWSGKKPLIQGYINSGTIGLKEGSVKVTETNATGSFVLDMNTLDVGLTAKKPGQEGALEGHLKGDRFFDVAKYPTATFQIKEVIPNSESDVTFTYNIRGDLTMKGATHEISFPAKIYFKDNLLVAEAETEIDRTKWGLTALSGNFAENLGDNLVDDMVAISFNVKAQKAQ